MTQMDLLAPVRMPKQGTQHYTLLMALKQGVRLTIWNAMVDYGCGALHQRIKELRDGGWPINRQVVTKNGKQVAEFWM